LLVSVPKDAESPIASEEDPEGDDKKVAATDAQKKIKKEEERLRLQKEKDEKKIKKEEEKLKKQLEKEQKKAKKVQDKLNKKEDQKLRKELEKQGKKKIKQKHLPNSQTVDDFVLKGTISSLPFVSLTNSSSSSLLFLFSVWSERVSFEWG